MSAFATHFGFEFRTGIRNKNLLLMNYLFPISFFLLMGYVMPEVNPAFRDTMIPAMVTFAIVAATLLGLPDPLVAARESGIFRSYRINGVPALSLLLIPALTTALHTLIVTVIISLTAPIFFGAAQALNWVNFFFVTLALVMASSGLGVLIGVVSPSTRMTVLYSQAVFIPTMLLGGLMLPTNLLPEAIRSLAFLLPASHAMNAFNGLAMGYQVAFNAWMSVAILVAGSLSAFLLALFLFNWDSKNSERRSNPLLALLALLPYVIGILAQSYAVV